VTQYLLKLEANDFCLSFANGRDLRPLSPWFFTSCSEVSSTTALPTIHRVALTENCECCVDSSSIDQPPDFKSWRSPVRSQVFRPTRATDVRQHDHVLGPIAKLRRTQFGRRSERSHARPSSWNCGWKIWKAKRAAAVSRASLLLLYIIASNINIGVRRRESLS